MNRASSTPAARAVDRLLMANKPPTEICGCDHAIELQRRVSELEAHVFARRVEFPKMLGGWF